MIYNSYTGQAHDTCQHINHPHSQNISLTPDNGYFPTVKTLYQHKETTHTQIVCQSCTSTHYMYVSNPVLKVSNGIHVNVYVCNPALHSLWEKIYNYCHIFWLHHCIRSAVLSKFHLGWGLCPYQECYISIGQDRDCIGVDWRQWPLVSNLITGSAPLYIGALRF